MLSNEQIEFYHENGYAGVEGVFSSNEIAALREVTDEFVERSRAVSENDEVFDLEPGHTAEEPRLRRVKSPTNQHQLYNNALHHDGMLDIVAQLIGDGIRTNGTKLNLKLPKFGSPVEWHQDWSFYPHTNDDLLAIGICIDEMTVENGALLVIPGSHRDPIHDHHLDGLFCGAITDPAFDDSSAVPLELPAGSISIHHARIIHGSIPNRSSAPRRLLLFQMAAIDAWPLTGVTDLAEFNSHVLRGTPTIQPRLADVPVRIPLPTAGAPGSIYESQMRFKDRKLV
jgi:ectoine hydroxylase-related dioxygenase (phytanoyl-CoA dioxygenase family)